MRSLPILVALGLVFLAAALALRDPAPPLPPPPDHGAIEEVPSATWDAGEAGEAVEPGEPADPDLSPGREEAPPAAPPAGQAPAARQPHPKSISGVVVHHRGQVPAALGLQVGTGPLNPRARRTAVARDGSFETPPLEPGSYTLRAVTSCGLECGQSVGIAPGARGVRVVLHSTGEISGVLLDAKGTPAKEGILVVAEAPGADRSRPGGRSTAWTASDGTFVVQFLRDFEFSLSAGEGTGSTRLAPFVAGWAVKGVRTGSGGVTVRLADPEKVIGMLLGADGSPAPGVGIRGLQERRNGLISGRSGPRGDFVLDGFARGPVKLQALRSKAWKDLTVIDAPVRDLLLTLPRE